MVYFGALIQLKDGTKKVVEADGRGPLGLMKFMTKIGDYAKPENKLIKVCCDDVRALDFLTKNLKDQGTKVEFGVPGILEMEWKEDEPKKN